MTDHRETSNYSGWQQLVRKYAQPDHRKSLWQMANSFGGLLLSLTAMYFSLTVGYWLTLLLAPVAAGFLVRVFIIQHDCGHNAFFRQRGLNDVVGFLCSVFTMVPYRFWRKTHAIHHATSAELETRGIGDVWTLTVDEYLEARWWTRAIYRVFRNPVFLFFLAPSFSFLVVQRFPVNAQKGWPKDEPASVWWTNLALAASFVGLSFLIGPLTVLSITLPSIALAASVGTWLFYVQHQFERTYWEHTPEWDYTLAAMHGSSYYRLPRVLQWFTGNIGFHHIHHLSPRIPNYNLQRCHDENPLFQRVANLTLLGSFKTAVLTLWDEKKRRLVTFREALQVRRGATVG